MTLRGNRRLQFSLAGLLGMTTLCAIAVAWAVHEPSPSLPDLSKPIKNVRVELFNGEQVIISDAHLIETLVVAPLRKARRDPRPARYEVLGFIEIDNGSLDGMSVFLPWGHFKYDEVYGVADFSLLQAEVRKSLPNSPAYLFDRVVAPNGSRP